MREALALLIPVCAVAAVLPALPTCTGRRSPAFTGLLAIVLGVGLSSVTTFALIGLGMSPRDGRFIAADAAIWVALGALGSWIRRRGTRVAAPSEPAAVPDDPDRVGWIVRALFAAAAVAALAAAITIYRTSPHGDWDAWAIWNQHARFLFRGGGEWRAMLEIGWSHPDYPLLLPASVARLWAYAGGETTLAPAMLGMVFGGASVALVMTALDLRRRRAWMAGAVLLGAGAFVTQIASQCADVPLAAFIVAALAVRGGLLEHGRFAGVLVAGGASAMAAWTKNEGLVFALLMLALVTADAVRHGRTRQVVWWIAGGAPALAAIAWFKLAYAPASWMFEGQSFTMWADRLLNPDRHLVVATSMAEHLVRWGAPLAAAIVPVVGVTAAALAVARGGVEMRRAVSIVAAMFAAYYLVYVTTPFDIAWHVSTSFDRLLVQVWPPLVLAAFLSE